MLRRVKYGGAVATGDVASGDAASIPVMATDRLVERIARCVTGLALFGVGISLQIESRLGNPPWDAFHQGVANQVGMGIGTVIILTGVALLVLFWIPLRQKPGLGTILGGILLVALGSALYIGSGLGPGPRDGIMTGLAARGVKIRVARIGIEVTVLAIGWLLGGQVGVGTVLFALAIGPLVAPLLPRLSMRPRAPQI